MLFQIQQQSVDDNKIHEFVAQREWTTDDSQETMQAWIADVTSRHELLDRMQWLVCDENSPYFFWAANQWGKNENQKGGSVQNGG